MRKSGSSNNRRLQTTLDIEVVKKSNMQRGFVVIRKRWVVERTLGWLCRSRILNKEYERTLESSRADVLHAMAAVMLRRLTMWPEERKEAR